MSTDWKALCAELVNDLHDYKVANEQYEDALVNRARAALAQPEPQGPSGEDLIQLAIDTRLYRFQATAGDPIQYEMTEQQIHAFARAVLARFGRRAIEPVPVSERLPGPGDCDGEGCCWWWIVDQPGELPHWIYCTLEKLSWTNFRHWLPHHALPVPQQEVE
jgi:hypothetical protein